jgi:alpha-beta hydrolase superfamily lysophospholipase
MVVEEAPADGCRRTSLAAATYTGLSEREHLASPSNDLENSYQDILAVIKYEDLRDVVLVGHSCGGMVATGLPTGARPYHPIGLSSTHLYRRTDNL